MGRGWRRRWLVWGSKSCPFKGRLREPWAHLLLGWVDLGSLPVGGRPQGQVPTGPEMVCHPGSDGKRGGAWGDGQRDSWIGVGQQLPEGLPRAEDRNMSPPGTQRVCPNGRAGLGSLRIKGVGRRLPECFRWFCFLGVGDQKLFSSLELCLPKQETVVLCCHYFFRVFFFFF